jgi:hypothetical protein
LFAVYHAADGDPLQWGSVFFFAASFMFAVAVTVAYYVGMLLYWVWGAAAQHDSHVNAMDATQHEP